MNIVERSARANYAAEKIADMLNELFDDMGDNEQAACIMAVTMLLMQSTAIHCVDTSGKSPRETLRAMYETSLLAFPEEEKKVEELRVVKVKPGKSPWAL